MTKNDAITTLGKWTDIKVTEQQSSDVASGEVISQNPAADETADPDQPIEIVVSSGNEAPASEKIHQQQIILHQHRAQIAHSRVQLLQMVKYGNVHRH